MCHFVWGPGEPLGAPAASRAVANAVAPTQSRFSFLAIAYCDRQANLADIVGVSTAKRSCWLEKWRVKPPFRPG